MKNIFKMLALAVVAVLTATAMVSCDDDDDDWSGPCLPPDPMAIVTYKTDSTTGQLYLQLNDSVTIIPTNIKVSPFGNKEVRAHILFKYPDSVATPHRISTTVMLLDTIRTKPMAPIVDNMDKVYGNDPLEIVDNWETVCEDGYLTLRFRTYFSYGIVHSLNLVRTGDNTVELRHNANGDVRGRVADGIIAFRLSDMPDTKGQYKDLVLKWKSFSGEKSVTFKYKSRE